ncbi:MAG TPA: glycoside hydrolase family 3 C-terminal domain-containing protein [Candidatus Limnocylindrales bacterium]
MTQPADNARQIPFSVERLDALVRSLTIEERARLTSGTDTWHAGGVESIGLAPMLTLDGPNGVRGMTFPEGSSATCTPCGTGLGATWDVDLVAEVAARIGLECRRAGVQYLLGPVLNMVRSPLGGRDFECYSEDPMLTAQLGVAYVVGIQSQGVAACPKHLAANESEMHRTTVNCIVDERALREIYLLPFEAVARAGAWSMMAAYNLVNGVHCSQNVAFIGGILREEIGWDGVLMSDWHATHDTVADANAGLDLEMPGPPRFLGPALAAAVRRGNVDEEILNTAALHVLTLAARVGALPLDAEIGAGAPRTAPAADETIHLSDADAAALVRRAAAESFVLLSNDGTLPLAPAKLRKVAVLGPNAAVPCIQGSGAAHVDEPYAITPLDGLRAALAGKVEIVHEPAPAIGRFLPPLTEMEIADLDGNAGLTIEFFRGHKLAGTPVARYNVKSSELELFGDLPAGLVQDDFSARISTWLTPAATGAYRITMRGLGGRRLLVDGVVAADEWNGPTEIDVPTAMFEGKEQGDDLQLEAGKRVLIVGEVNSTTQHPSRLALGCTTLDATDWIAASVAAAAASDVAVVVVGTDDTWEAEGRDRITTTLPGRQDELVGRVAAANKKTVVVVNAGSPVELPWSDKVAAIIYAWLPGQEFGNALADVLLGVAEPGGRLPISLAARAADFPAYDTTPGPDERLVYSEGVNVGYRGFDAAGIEPRFAFGHGLGYTTFKFESLTLASDGLADGEPLELRVKLRNTGKRPGKEVVQVYIADLEASVPRPPRELKGFAVVRLEPGEVIEIAMALEDRDLAYWDAARHSWRMEPGRFEVQVGRSSRDIRLRQEFELA